ncbi:hypothetical protein [Erwinia rhapontici]|uniref:hypothetical protein n=1 Tax=Erwinia rhapontici TaxID=55212 RepID=UPI003BA1AE8B
MTRFSQAIEDKVNVEKHHRMMDHISSEFGDEMLRTILLLNARLMTLSMDDLKSVVVSVVARDDAKLTMKRDSTGIDLKIGF